MLGHQTRGTGTCKLQLFPLLSPVPVVSNFRAADRAAVPEKQCSGALMRCLCNVLSCRLPIVPAWAVFLRVTAGEARTAIKV